MAEYPAIALVLDIHRDAVEDENGGQMRMACTIDGEDAAKLMLVVGTDAGAWSIQLAGKSQPGGGIAGAAAGGLPGVDAPNQPENGAL